MTRGKDSDIDDLDAMLAAAYLAEPEIVTLGTPKGRKAREKRAALKHTDGRRKRGVSKEQTKQLNVAIRKELHERLALVSRAQRLMMVEAVEQALEAYLPKLEKRAKHA